NLPHLTTAGLKRHQLLDPVEDLEARICSEHNKPFELFCRTDQRIVCMFWVLFDHKNHDYVPVNVEAGQKKFELRETEVKLNQMIQERRAKMEGLKHTSKLNKESADRQAAAGLQVFVDLKQIFENGLDQLSKNIENSQTKVEQLTQNFIAELGLEVKVLMQSSANVYQLLLSNDHVHVLQTFSSVNRVPAVKDWSAVSVPLPLYEKMVRKAVVKTVGQLQTLFRKPKMKPHEAELQRRQSCKNPPLLQGEHANFMHKELGRESNPDLFAARRQRCPLRD
uniref:B box-type domain-containing protein n=1 Tax=Cyprinodon variegatus TaxID=28743 RepID=A0A3Q2CYF3_CYPVA